jgi:hypothetical protein
VATNRRSRVHAPSIAKRRIYDDFFFYIRLPSEASAKAGVIR